MAVDPQETKDGGVLRDAYGRKQLVVSTKHAPPSVTDLPTPDGPKDADGREQIVLVTDAGDDLATRLETLSGNEFDAFVTEAELVSLRTSALYAGLGQIGPAESVTVDPNDVSAVITGTLASGSSLTINGLRPGLVVTLNLEQDAVGSRTLLLPQVRGAQPVIDPGPLTQTVALLVSPDGATLLALGASSASLESITDAAAAVTTGA